HRRGRPPSRRARARGEARAARQPEVAGDRADGRLLSRGGYGVVVAALVVAGACGGSVTPAPGNYGGDADDTDVGIPSDAQPLLDNDAPSGMDAKAPDTGIPAKQYDGTTGQKCASDADCTTPGGPGIARCSSTVFAPESYFATPACILPTCSPVSE